MHITKEKYHEKISEYFLSKPIWFDENRDKPNVRKLIEQPWQQTKGKMWDEVISTLSNLIFIEARFRISKVFEFIIDYRLVRESLPESKETFRKEREKDERSVHWAASILEYSRKINELRERSERREHITEAEPKMPEIISSSEPWNSEQVEVECQRIISNPTRLDRLYAFENFVNEQCFALLKYVNHSNFVLQQAFNFAPSGPVHDASILIMDNKNPILLRQWRSNADYNPKPALQFTMEGHTEEITCLTITPDGKYVVSGSNDNDVRVWDLLSGECIHVLKGHHSAIQSVAISYDGLLAMSAGAIDSNLRLWDLKIGQCFKIINCHSSAKAIALTPDGRRAVCSGFFGEFDKLWVWDLENGKLLSRTLDGHSNVITSLSMTANGSLVISASRSLRGNTDGCLKIWDLEKGICLKTLQVKSAIKCVTMTPDGRVAISVSENNMQVWNLGSGICQHVLECDTGAPHSVAITSDGKIFASLHGSNHGRNDNSIRVWNTNNGKCLKIIKGLSGSVNCISITADGRQVISGGKDATLRVWNIEYSRSSDNFSENDPNEINGLVLTISHGCSVSIMNTSNVIHKWKGQNSQYLNLWQNNIVAITADGRLALSFKYLEDKLFVWDIKQDKCVHIIQQQFISITCLVITPDGSQAVTGGTDAILRVWDIDTGKCVYAMKGHLPYYNSRLAINSVTLTLDGKLAISGSEDKTLKVWDIEKGQCIRTLNGHTSSIKKVLNTGYLHIVLSTSYDNTVRVWDIEKGMCLHTIQHNTFFGRDNIVLTADGLRIITLCQEKILQIWDLITGRCTYTLQGDFHRFNSLIASPDGRLIVIGCDRTVQVWDLENEKLIAISVLKMSIRSIMQSENLIIIENDTELDILDLRNIERGSSISRPVHIYNFITKNWETQLSCQCEKCGKRFNMPTKIIDSINKIHNSIKNLQDHSPSMDLHTDPLNNSNLIFNCPECANPYKINPSFICSTTCL